jgi:Recombination endonuclease VII
MREREENIERVRAWRRANSERYRQTQARYRKLRVSQQRADRLRRAFGLTVEAYESLLVVQDGGCAICGREPTRIALHVDHDHESGAIRGLLCVGCNNALGQFKDSTELLSRAIAYLHGDLLTFSATADLVDVAHARAGELRRTSV